MKKASNITSTLNTVEHKCALYTYSTQILQVYKSHLAVHSIEKPFKCPECPFRTKWKSGVARHVNNVHLFGLASMSSRPFPCSHPGCSYAAKEKGNLVKHSKIHSDEKSFFCSHPNCNYATNNKQHFIVHTRTHTGEKPYKCPFESCSYAAAQPNQLAAHTRTHTKERPFKCPEPNCEYSATRNHVLKQHQLTHSPKEGQERPSFKCPLCEYSSKSQSRLATHAKSHTLEKLFKCDELNCNYEAKTKQHMKNHKISKHSDEKLFACSIESCEFRCKFRGDLSKHLKTHSQVRQYKCAERRYKCELCPFRATTRSTVHNHLKSVHSDLRPFTCTEPMCDVATKTKQGLNLHLLTHKADKKYSCSFPMCHYKAIKRSMVKLHQMRVHENEKRFKCAFCDFATKEKCSLIKHMRTHTKETPYICKAEGCQYQSKGPTPLREHQKRKHPQMVNQNK